MLQRRTDLAVEAHDLWKESAARETALPGVRARDDVREGCPVTRVEILDRQGAAALGKPEGQYVTLELSALERREPGALSRAVRAIAAELTALLGPLPAQAPVLVVGLGNRAITPDAIGPLVHDCTLVTRHLVGRMPEQFGHLRPVASVAAEVMGSTGLESRELVASVCQSIRPCCVIAVDALASRSLGRLCRTVQLADTGISPGSGVGNHRAALDQESLGVPVLAVGVPTVVEGATLAADLLGADCLPQSAPGRDILVTPRDIDRQVADLSKILGYGISMALQPSLGLEELELLLS